jgi:hypothetical protein
LYQHDYQVGLKIYLMKIKLLKGFLPLTAAAFLLGSCSDDKFGSDSSSGKQISFRLQGSLPSSRTTGTTKDNINAFVVNAQTDLPDDAGLLFSSQTVARLEGTANAFDYSPKRYYPDEAAFACYSAYSPVSKYVEPGFKNRTEGEINTITYTVPKPSDKGDTTQEDLLVAYTKVAGNFDNPVSLNFKHALSRVFVKASNKNVEPVVIKELSLHNLYSQGKLKIDENISKDYPGAYKVLWTPDEAEPKVSYPYVLLPTGVSVPAETDKLGTDKYVSVVGNEQGMMVLPQTTINSGDPGKVEDGDFFVEVTYSISNIKEKIVRAAFTDINRLANKGITFEMGRQYALALEFSDTEVEFKISVEDWDGQTDAYAATTVVFAENKPAEAAQSFFIPCGINDNTCSNFIHGQSIEETTGGDVLDQAAPILDGWIFLGYYDAREDGTKYFCAGADGKLKVADDIDGNWDKAGPSCTLYAHWAEATNKWATSNVYFKPDEAGGVVGSLTFAQSIKDWEGYQGLYFKWGSLIGVAAGPSSEDFTGGTYLYIPDLGRGKYYKVKVSEVTAGSTVDAAKALYDYLFGLSVTWAGGGSDWDKIPYVKDGSDPDQIPSLPEWPTVADRRADHRLTDKSIDSDLYGKYKGDICKFLSDKKGSNGSGLTRNWVMPTSDKWQGANSPYLFEGGKVTVDGDWLYIWTDNDTANGTADGEGRTLSYLTYSLDTGESVVFPAAGDRDGDGDGRLDFVGVRGFYWSSAVFDASNAYNLYFRSFYVAPVFGSLRTYGFPVRCVQEL